MKNKRRLDEQDDDLVNVLRQRFKQDEKQKEINGKLFFSLFFFSLLLYLEKNLNINKGRDEKINMAYGFFFI